jgi:hypothetical protein
MSLKRFIRVVFLILCIIFILVSVLSCGTTTDNEKQGKTDGKKSDTEKGTSSQEQEKPDPAKQARDLIKNPNF